MALTSLFTHIQLEVLYDLIEIPGFQLGRSTSYRTVDDDALIFTKNWRHSINLWRGQVVCIFHFGFQWSRQLHRVFFWWHSNTNVSISTDRSQRGRSKHEVIVWEMPYFPLGFWDSNLNNTNRSVVWSCGWYWNAMKPLLLKRTEVGLASLWEGLGNLALGTHCETSCQIKMMFAIV